MNTDPSCQSDADPSSLPLEIALQRLLDAIAPLHGEQRVSLGDALGRTLAEDLYSPMNVPPFRASAMDGFALRHNDVADNTDMPVSGVSLAGHPADDTLPPWHCVRIMTGARVPDEADTVVQIENTIDRADSMMLRERPRQGQHVRPAGSDTGKGDLLAAAGTRLWAADVGVLASAGIVEVSVRREVRIGILSTGDELQAGDTTLAPGSIHDANGPLLEAMLSRPGQTVRRLGICRDDPDALRERLTRASELDMLIASGGVSVGDADHVRDVLAQCGSMNFWKIAVKPGRPLTVGTLADGCHFFGLPGNPVSVVATSLLFVLPAIARLRGEAVQKPWSLPAILDTRLSKLPGRVEYQRGILYMQEDGQLHVGTTGLQDSHVLRSVQTANCLIELPVASTGADAGDAVRVLPFSQFGSPLL